MLARILTKLRRISTLPALRKARDTSLRHLRERQPIGKVLVVCHGNIYRSAFVGELLRQKVSGGVQVRSAGFYPKAGRPSPERHVEMSRKYGVSLEKHASAVYTADDLRWADIVVLMDRKNLQELRESGADAQKLVWLGALGPGNAEIEDPYTMTDAQASALLDRLASCTEALAAAIGGRATSALPGTTASDRRG
jgi:protein-tyrosine phosphatase